MQQCLPEWSLAAVTKLEQHPWFVRSRRILLFHSLPDEVCTHELIKRYQDVKEILLPTVVGDYLELHFCNSASNTHRGAFNIIESQGDLLPESQYHTIDLAVIPGVAFDASGNRLGRGRGYYDRLLPHLDCHTIGLCFPFQLIDAVPHEAHDKAVDAVVSA